MKLEEAPWREVLEPEKTSVWAHSFQGSECIPPTQAWACQINSLIEMWAFHYEAFENDVYADTWIVYSRFRSSGSAWWNASVDYSDVDDLEGAKANAINLLREQLQVHRFSCIYE